MHREHACAAPLSNSRTGAIAVPAANSDLHQVLRMAIRQTHIVHMAMVAMRGVTAFMSRPKPGRGMHPLIHILLLDIDVAVDMDDADVAVDVRSDATDIGKSEAMIAAADDREHTGRVNVRNRFCYLIEGLFDVSGDNENVSRITEIEFLVNIDAAIEPVSVIERRDAPYGLRPETGARPVRCR